MEITKDIFIDGNLIEGSKIVVRYRGKFTVEYSNEVFIVYGYGLGWKNIKEQKMTWVGDCFCAEIELTSDDSLNFCFKNNFGSWDNNNGKDYSVYIKSKPKEVIPEPVKVVEEVKQSVEILPKKEEPVKAQTVKVEVENVSDVFETVGFVKEKEPKVEIKPEVIIKEEPKVQIPKEEKVEPRRELKKDKKDSQKKFEKKDKKNKKNRYQKKIESKLKQEKKNIQDTFIPNYEDEESLYEYVYSSYDSEKDVDVKKLVNSEEINKERVLLNKSKEKASREKKVPEKRVKEKTPKKKEEKKSVEARRSIEPKRTEKPKRVKEKTKVKEKNIAKEKDVSQIQETTSIKNGRVVKESVNNRKNRKNRKDKIKTKPKKKNKILKRIIRITLLLVLIACIVYSVINYIKSQNVKDDAKKLLEIKTDNIEPSEIQENEMLNKVKALNMQYPDLKGWLEIKDTEISYPVMQGTDNDFYITHDYEKEYSKWGSLFLDKDYDWSKPSSNLLIYGHNFSDGYMFADLLKYRNKEFYESHKTIRFITPADDSEYEIISVFNSRVYYKHETDVFRYYFFVDANSKVEYNDFVNNAKKASIYDIEATAEFGEQLITLSTCDYTQEDGRFVIVARKITD